MKKRTVEGQSGKSVLAAVRSGQMTVVESLNSSGLIALKKPVLFWTQPTQSQTQGG